MHSSDFWLRLSVSQFLFPIQPHPETPQWRCSLRQRFTRARTSPFAARPWASRQHMSPSGNWGVTGSSILPMAPSCCKMSWPLMQDHTKSMSPMTWATRRKFSPLMWWVRQAARAECWSVIQLRYIGCCCCICHADPILSVVTCRETYQRHTRMAGAVNPRYWGDVYTGDGESHHLPSAEVQVEQLLWDGQDQPRACVVPDIRRFCGIRWASGEQWPAAGTCWTSPSQFAHE